MKGICNIAVFIIALTAVCNSYAQAPNITYPDQSYKKGVPITPVLPVNTGGAVPATPFGQVTNYAGGSTIPGFVNAHLLAARFNAPYDIKQDASGNLYIADAGNNVIRKIDAAGDVTTYAGTGVAGSLDGVRLLSAFNGPTGLVFDKEGNLFVADRKNHTIRKITPEGSVTTLAGLANASGLINAQGSFARFNLPTGIAVDDNGGLFVTDYGNNVIRHVAQDGNTNVTSGSGTSGWIDGSNTIAAFNNPNGIVNIGAGIFYITDASHIRSMDKDGNIVTVAGNFFTGSVDGYGKGALLNGCTGMVKDAAGVVFFTDRTGSSIRRFDPSGEIKTIATAPFVAPAGLTIDKDGVLYVADEGAHVIRTVYTTGYSISPALPAGLIFDRTTGQISGTPTETRQLSNYTVIAYNTSGKSVFGFQLEVREAVLKPQQITFGPLPTVTVGDQDFPPGATSSNPNIPIEYESSNLNLAFISNGKIHMVAPGKVTITAKQRGDVDYAEAIPVPQELTILPPPELDKPDVVAKAGPFVFALDKFGTLTLTPDQLATITPGPQKPDITKTIRPTGTFTCEDLGEQDITVGAGYGPDPADPLNAQFDQPAALAFDRFGNFYVTDQAFYKVRKYDLDTRVTTIAGGISGFRDGNGGNVAFGRGLSSIATDSHGNIFVCDYFNNAVRKIDPDGNATTFAFNELKAANGGNFAANAIAVDKNDNIFVANATKIFRITPDGSTVTLFAGSGNAANLDGIGATASFSGIRGLAFDGSGFLYVSTSDLNNVNTVRKIAASGATATIISLPYAANFTRLVVNSKGIIFIASSLPVIYRLTDAGDFTKYAGGIEGFADGPKATAQFRNPQGIGIDSKDNLYIVDSDNHRIRMISTTGKVTTIAGSGEPGDKDNTNRSNATKVTVKVKIVSALNITGAYADVNMLVAPQCPALLPDYATDAHAESTCAHNITITQSPQAGTTIVAGQTIKVTLTATDDLGQSSTATFNVNAIPVASPTVTIAPVSSAVCDGSPITFKATAADEGNSPTFQWRVNNALQAATGSTFTYNAPADGDKVTCTVLNTDYCAGIPSEQSALYVVSTEASIATALIITPSTTDAICAGVALSFTAVPSNVQTATQTPDYQWKVNGDLKGSNSATFTSSTLRNGDIVTCEMDSHVKCSALPITISNPITVQVKTDAECAITIANTFTPNGDGRNDLWDIPELVNFPDCVFSVYNRYGKVVYRSVGYTKPWDGTYSGNQLAPGTYYYLIDLKTGRPPLSGPVTILR
ncbi:hypothetical protein DYU05_12210 [Mucilaginibacter terrenus]|uniref:Ig-like domain-containing protein n=1 Tax=Mucilaginibacter terrenus TaxID=2482727 RepID=A0A3E2NPH9_9SPHI|nr:gliding motility-associated C-terminal domain-containing protein [Mucilaginibacter terrenus]RFZ82916.1 hypothetical protein DYU05_12210 [Mucilaginibacter terrenus]